jgi:hypothetical protein
MQISRFGGALAIAMLAYLAYPYYSLYQLGDALRRGDGPAVESKVDWPRVRAGIKQDVTASLATDPAADGLGGAVTAALAGVFLDSMIDARFSPTALAKAAGMAHGEQLPSVDWAFFDGPTSFAARVHALGMTETIRLRLELEGFAWTVTRVFLPLDQLPNSSSPGH